MKKRDSRQPTFDFDGDGAGVSRSSVHDAERTSPSIWSEVPSALFFSWSDARQYEYCARRDEDSAAKTEGEEREFYVGRARIYRSMV